MALKTFNVDEEAYKQFSEHCKKSGISMSKKVGNFIKEELERLKLGIKKVENKIEQKEQKNVLVSEKLKEHSFMKYC